MMIDEKALSIFNNVRMISVSRLAQQLGVERDEVLSKLPEWEARGIIRVAKASGCGSCEGCGASSCSPNEPETAPDEKMLISRVKVLTTQD
jgi:DNA-binding transcriptional MocR family regulator